MNKIVALALIVASLLQLACRSTSVGPQEKDYHNRILFTSRRSGNQQLSVMNPDGSNVEQITSGPFEHYYGRWSPDASKIVCNTSEGWTTAGSPIVVFNVDGTERKIIAAGNTPSWSPDGRRIAYSYMPYAETGLNVSFIYVVNADGSNRVQLTEGTVSDARPCWASDGLSLYFTSDRHNPGNLNVDTYAMQLDGTNIRRITNSPSGSTTVWQISSAGTEMLAVTIKGNAIPPYISILGVNGSHERLILQGTSGEAYLLPRWSGDEGSIVFVGVFTDGTARTRLHRMAIDGSVVDLIPEDVTASYPDWSR
jgi:Tol biopolymer transport system component